MKEYTIVVKKDDKVIYKEYTGMIYDAWIKACQIRDDLKDKYPGCDVGII